MVFVMPDVSQLGDALAARAAGDSLLRDTIVYLTCVHELGHALGLPHTDKFADIMYSFGYGGDIVNYFMRYRENLKGRSDISRLSGLSAADAAALRSLYP
jgi:predicted Zn-dependent protease